MTKIQVDTKFGPAFRDLDWISNPVLNRFELGRNDRAEEQCRNPTCIFYSFWYYFSSLLMVTITRSYNELKVYVRLAICSGICEASHEQARTTFTILDAGRETYLVDVAFNTSPDVEPNETTQNIVEIPAVRELVICHGNCLKSSLWSGSTLNSQVVTCRVEFHANSNSSCVSA